MDELYLVIGIPGAGKTTYSSRFDSVLHYDDISKYPIDERIKIQSQTEAECIEGIYNTVSSRKRLLDCVNRQHKVCIWIDAPVEECIRRDGVEINRPRELILYHSRIFQPPTYDEGWDEIIRIKNYECEHIEI